MYQVQYLSNHPSMLGVRKVAHFKTLKQARAWWKAGVSDGSYKKGSATCMQHNIDVTAWFLEK